MKLLKGLHIFQSVKTVGKEMLVCLENHIQSATTGWERAGQALPKA